MYYDHINPHFPLHLSLYPPNAYPFLNIVGSKLSIFPENFAISFFFKVLSNKTIVIVLLNTACKIISLSLNLKNSTS